MSADRVAGVNMCATDGAPGSPTTRGSTSRRPWPFLHVPAAVAKALGSGWRSAVLCVVVRSFGRRKVTLWVMPLAVAAGCLPALPTRWLGYACTHHDISQATSYYYLLLAVARLLLGVGIGGCSCVFVLLMEYHVRAIMITMGTLD